MQLINFELQECNQYRIDRGIFITFIDDSHKLPLKNLLVAAKSPWELKVRPFFNQSLQFSMLSL